MISILTTFHFHYFLETLIPFEVRLLLSRIYFQRAFKSFDNFQWLLLGSLRTFINDFQKHCLIKNFFLFSEVQFRLNSTKLSPTEVPSSVCSLPCPEGQMKKYDEGESCCWTCHECIAYQVSFKANRFWTILFFFTDDISIYAKNQWIINSNS